MFKLKITDKVTVGRCKCEDRLYEAMRGGGVSVRVVS